MQSYWVSDKFTVDGRLFFRECSRSSAGDWRVCVYMLGQEEEASEFEAEVS